MGGSSDRPRIAVHSLGCRVNRAEADALVSSLAGECALAGEGEPADVVVVNTCTVTADAARVARQVIRRAARESPRAWIVAAGCHAEVAPQEIAGLPGVRAVVGAREAGRLEEVVRAVLREAATGTPTPTAGVEPSAEAPHARPALKIQDGCDARCSYCVVPLARGPGRSLPVREALDSIRRLGETADEVVLAGVHLGAYGRDLSPRASLQELLDRAGGVHRVRLSSIEPHELPERLPGIVCEHLHLPLQSGSDRVLAAMRRTCRAAGAARAVERALRAMPSACLGADLMCGFPGETDADHRETVRLVAALPLAYLHVFAYSPRPGTDAARLPPVDRAAARARAAELRAISEERRRGFLDGLVGRELEVVVERVGSGVAQGTSREYATVRWPAGGERRGRAVRVRVTGRDGGTLTAVPAGAASVADPFPRALR